MDIGRLTTEDYWNGEWRESPPRHRFWLYRDSDFETVGLLRRKAGGGNAWVLEVGAGNSRILPYIARKYGYRAFGSDFSAVGCARLKANFESQQQKGLVIREDLFQSALRPESFDIVYSSGVIEHFDDTRAVIAEHLRSLKHGGRLVLIVPNLQGLHGKLVRKLAPPLWNLHKVFGPDDLEGMLRDLGLNKIEQGYLGSFFFSIGRDAPWSRVQEWPRLLRFAVPALVRAGNALVSLGFRFSPLRPHSKAFSPAFFATGVKP